METIERFRYNLIHGATCFQFVKRMNGNSNKKRRQGPTKRAILLPIREAYEWKRWRSFSSWRLANKNSLLPIREAYEWKLVKDSSLTPSFTSCFQFVKRMNGNISVRSLDKQIILLPIREAYEWKHPCTQGGQHAIRLSCFQFVKRMNGNCFFTDSAALL